VAALASRFLVMDLQVLFGTTDLASPAITPEHLLSESVVQLGIEPQAWLFGQNPIHEAFSAASCRKACR
jgi:hypothetical protein